MSWSKVSERRWERAIDGIEGRQHYIIIAKARLDLDVPGADNELALKEAWKQLRHEQPRIATTVENSTKVYEKPDEAALQAWLTATFVVSGAPDAETLWDTVPPIAQTTLYYLPRSSELVLRGHHHVVDGIGLFIFGDEVTRLAPPLAEVLGVPNQSTPEQTERVTSLLTGYARKVLGIGPVVKVNSAPAGPGHCRNSRLTFPPQPTEAIIQICKNRKITDFRCLADPSTPSSHYVTSASFDLRRYLPKPYNSAHYGASVWYSPLPFHLDLPASFWAIPNALSEYYRTSFRNDPALRLTTPHYNRFMETFAGSPEYQNTPIPHDALPSSLGVIERYVQHEYGSIASVRDLMVGVGVVLGMSVFFISTFRETLQVVYSFNDGYEVPADIGRYLEGIRDVLVEELLA
ncbi:hypothetical protein BDW69DRAFT_191342 [Aspergillus filifer]